MRDTIRHPSVVPDNASLEPGHWLCRLLRHRGTNWTEDVITLTDTATRVTLPYAECRCGREQKKVRITWPAAYTVTIWSGAITDE